MDLRRIGRFLLLALFFVVSQAEDDDVDYSSESISQNIQNLKIEGAEYLQKVMKQLQNERTNTQVMEISDLTNLLYTHRMYDVGQDKENYNVITPVYNISGPTPVPDLEAEIVPEGAPPLSLSKEELQALYEAALNKATSLHLLQGGQKPNQEVPPGSSSSSVTEAPVQAMLQGHMGSPASGYYYYYFPIKSFLKPVAQSPTQSPVSKTTPARPQQLHATITMLESPNKSMEPLFMAISGFIGMALMFFFSVLFVPKFSKIRSKNAQFKDTPNEMATFAQLILEAMTGKDCSERLACEIARIFGGIKSNNKPLRVLEIILPPNLSQQIAQIRKAAGKKARCSYIPCKMKKPPPPKNQKPKPWKRNETPHDLWMKHFEKEKKPNKPQQQPPPPPPRQKQQQQQKNGWNRKPPVKKNLKPSQKV